MPKSTTAGMDTHLAGNVISMASCVRITRTDGTKLYRTTTHDQDLAIDLGDGDGENLYQSEFTVDATAIASTDQLNVDNLEVEGVVSVSGFVESDLRRGLYDFAVFEIFDVNWKDLTDGVIRHRKGTFGKVTVGADGRFKVELRGMMQLLSRTIIEAYSPECRANLGDDRCKIPIRPPFVARNTAYSVGDYVRSTVDGSAETDSFDLNGVIYRVTVAGTTAGSHPGSYNTTPGGPQVDGTVTMVVELSWSKAIEVSAVGSNPRKDFSVTTLTPEGGGTTPGRDYYPDDAFNNGGIIWEVGNNAGVGREIRDFDGDPTTQVFELLRALPYDIEVGDRARVYRGCLLRFTEDCVTIFDNGDNFRGEPFVPTKDVVGVQPEPKS